MPLPTPPAKNVTLPFGQDDEGVPPPPALLRPCDGPHPQVEAPAPQVEAAAPQVEAAAPQVLAAKVEPIPQVEPRGSDGAPDVSTLTPFLHSLLPPASDGESSRPDVSPVLDTTVDPAAYTGTTPRPEPPNYEAWARHQQQQQEQLALMQSHFHLAQITGQAGVFPQVYFNPLLGHPHRVMHGCAYPTGSVGSSAVAAIPATMPMCQGQPCMQPAHVGVQPAAVKREPQQSPSGTKRPHGLRDRQPASTSPRPRHPRKSKKSCTVRGCHNPADTKVAQGKYCKVHRSCRNCDKVRDDGSACKNPVGTKFTDSAWCGHADCTMCVFRHCKKKRDTSIHPDFPFCREEHGTCVVEYCDQPLTFDQVNEAWSAGQKSVHRYCLKHEHQRHRAPYGPKALPLQVKVHIGGTVNVSLNLDPLPTRQGDVRELKWYKAADEDGKQYMTAIITISVVEAEDYTFDTLWQQQVKGQFESAGLFHQGYFPWIDNFDHKNPDHFTRMSECLIGYSRTQRRKLFYAGFRDEPSPDRKRCWAHPTNGTRTLEHDKVSLSGLCLEFSAGDNLCWDMRQYLTNQRFTEVRDIYLVYSAVYSDPSFVSDVDLNRTIDNVPQYELLSKNLKHLCESPSMSRDREHLRICCKELIASFDSARSTLDRKLELLGHGIDKLFEEFGLDVFRLEDGCNNYSESLRQLLAKECLSFANSLTTRMSDLGGVPEEAGKVSDHLIQWRGQDGLTSQILRWVLNMIDVDEPIHTVMAVSYKPYIWWFNRTKDGFLPGLLTLLRQQHISRRRAFTRVVSKPKIPVEGSLDTTSSVERELVDVLAHVMSTAEYSSAYLCDLDKFENIEDTLGRLTFFGSENGARVSPGSLLNDCNLYGLEVRVVDLVREHDAIVAVAEFEKAPSFDPQDGNAEQISSWFAALNKPNCVILTHEPQPNNARPIPRQVTRFQQIAAFLRDICYFITVAKAPDAM